MGTNGHPTVECQARAFFSKDRKEVVVMNTSPKRILWWGVGFLIVGAIAFYAYTSAGVQTALTSDQTSQSLWFWLLSPALSIIQNVAFPVGAALIGASVVIRYLQESQSALDQQQTAHNEFS